MADQSRALESIIAPNVTTDGEMVKVGSASGKLVTFATKRRDHSRNVIHSSNAQEKSSSGTILNLYHETKGMFPTTFQNFVKRAENSGRNARERGELGNRLFWSPRKYSRIYGD
jgi:hypothetical protein